MNRKNLDLWNGAGGQNEVGWSTRGFSGLMTWSKESVGACCFPCWWGRGLSISPLSFQLPPRLERTALGLACEWWGWPATLQGPCESRGGHLPRALSLDLHHIPLHLPFNWDAREMPQERVEVYLELLDGRGQQFSRTLFQLYLHPDPGKYWVRIKRG